MEAYPVRRRAARPLDLLSVGEVAQDELAADWLARAAWGRLKRLRDPGGIRARRDWGSAAACWLLRLDGDAVAIFADPHIATRSAPPRRFRAMSGVDDPLAVPPRLRSRAAHAMRVPMPS